MSEHLIALRTRLAHEKMRLDQSKNESERTMRGVWVRGIEREIASERKFLGDLQTIAHSIDTMTDAELVSLILTLQGSTPLSRVNLAETADHDRVLEVAHRGGCRCG